MKVAVPVPAHDSRRVTMQVDDDLRAARHRDGVVLWWKSPGFETLAELQPHSPDGPYAPGGVAFLGAQVLPADESFAQAATRILSSGPVVQDIQHGVWEGAAAPCAWMIWTDGVADVTSAIVRWSDEILLTAEVSRDLARERHMGSTGINRPDLLAVLRKARPVEAS